MSLTREIFVPLSFPLFRLWSEQDGQRVLRTHSLSSYAGYHTPIEDEIAGGSLIIEGEGISDIPSDNGGLAVGRGSYQTQVCDCSAWVLVFWRLASNGRWLAFIVSGTFTQFSIDDDFFGCLLGSPADVV